MLNNNANLMHAGGIANNQQKFNSNVQTLYRTTNQLQSSNGPSDGLGSTDKNAELLRLKKEYH
jgi:hypothetical protein